MFYSIELLKFYLLWYCTVHPSLTYLSLDRMWDHLQKLLISPSSVPFFFSKILFSLLPIFFLSKSYDNRKSKFLDCLRFIIHDSISFSIIIINIVLRHYYSSSVYSLIFCWSGSDKDGWLFYFYIIYYYHYQYCSSSLLFFIHIFLDILLIKLWQRWMIVFLSKESFYIIIFHCIIHLQHFQ